MLLSVSLSFGFAPQAQLLRQHAPARQVVMNAATITGWQPGVMSKCAARTHVQPLCVYPLQVAAVRRAVSV